MPSIGWLYLANTVLFGGGGSFVFGAQRFDVGALLLEINGVPKSSGFEPSLWPAHTAIAPGAPPSSPSLNCNLSPGDRRRP